VRKKKSERKVSMKAPVKSIVIETEVDVSKALSDLKSTANALEIKLGKGKEEIAPGIKATIEF
jgi:hypothetical protein